MPDCFLDSDDKAQCYGCEACMQACHKGAIAMVEDEEGFRYPVIEESLCVHCNLCRKVCPHSNPPPRHQATKFVFGGYHKNAAVRAQSTSGGAFSAIVESWCDENYVIFGAVTRGLEVYHEYITDKKGLEKFRQSKYTQSHMDQAYTEAKKFLKQGKQVLFSGTPCHIAALKTYLGKLGCNENLLTVEVVCEGVPSPWYVRKYAAHLEANYKTQVIQIDYRYSDSCPIKDNEWPVGF